jgi:hypothetical protein
MKFCSSGTMLHGLWIRTEQTMRLFSPSTVSLPLTLIPLKSVHLFRMSPILSLMHSSSISWKSDSNGFRCHSEESHLTYIILCYRCGKARHKSTDCDLHFNICTCTVDELQGFLEDKLAALDVVAEEDGITVEEDKPKEKDFAICNK